MKPIHAVVKKSSSSFLYRNEMPEILIRTQASFSKNARGQLVWISADVCVFVCKKETVTPGIQRLTLSFLLFF